MRPLSFMLLLAFAVSAGSADLVRKELLTRELPAFDIDLPDGEITKQSTLAGTGALAMMLASDDAVEQLVAVFDPAELLPASGRQIQIQWDAFPIKTEEERKLVANTVVGALPFKGARVIREKPLAENRHLYLVGNEDLPLALGFVPCGENLGVTITMAFTRDVDDLAAAAERIALSVRCKSGGVALQMPQAALRLPKNFGRKAEEGVDMFLSTDGEMLAIVFAPQDLQRIPGVFIKVMAAMWSNVLGIPEDKMSLEVVDSAELQGKRSQFAIMHTSGDLDGSFINIRYCAEQDLSLFSLWYLEGGTLPQARERIQQVGCPGEPGEPVAEMPEVFGKACKNGDAFACEVLKEMNIAP